MHINTCTLGSEYLFSKLRTWQKTVTLVLKLMHRMLSVCSVVLNLLDMHVGFEGRPCLA